MAGAAFVAASAVAFQGSNVENVSVNETVGQSKDSDSPESDVRDGMDSWLEDDTPLACGIENPDECEACQ